MIDEWSKIGLQGRPSGCCRPARSTRRCAAAPSTVAVESNCQSVVNPLLDVAKVPAALGLSRELRRLRGPEADRALQHDAARDRSGQAARARCARSRSTCSTPRSHTIMMPWWYRIIAAPLLHEGLEDQPEPLPQPGPGEHLARQVAPHRPEIERANVSLHHQPAAAGDPDPDRGGGAGVHPDAPDPRRHLRGAAGRRRRLGQRRGARQLPRPARPRPLADPAVPRLRRGASSPVDFGISMWSGKPVIAGDRHALPGLAGDRHPGDRRGRR